MSSRGEQDQPASGLIDVEDDPLTEQELKLAHIVATLTDRLQRGEAIDIHAECQAHPDLARDLMSVWGTVVIANAVGSHEAVEAKSSDRASADSGTWRMPLPCILGDYELLEEIGRGGMGVVYRAQQLSLNREVAIKMILRDRLASDTERIRFFAEAKATAQLQHPGIVPVFDVGEIDGRPYFAMQFLRGKTLLELITTGQLDQREAARHLEKITRAVQFAHASGILHRDIKPSNILIDESGEARLTDFGLAKHTDSAESLTRTGVVLGTPTYMSPEQASGRMGEIGPASDIYSLGSVLYHALTGRPPFSAKSTMDVLLQVLEQDPPNPRLIDPKIDRDLEMIVVRCLQKPPELRYASAQALADDLAAYRKDEPISARSGQFAQIVARWFRETHHAPVLENWGVLWMWHSLVLFIACVLTEVLAWNNAHRSSFALLWTVGLGAWAAVFWAMRRRMGPVTFVERQIAHVWGASMIGIGALFPIEWLLGLEQLKLTPLIAVISAMMFIIKAGILNGVFYVQGACLLVTSIAMVLWPDIAHLVYGVVAGLCFFIPGAEVLSPATRVVAVSIRTA
jgi:eukaryotic-like serine/threonine-protein kinase